jgi:hypothetical protein
VLVKRRRDNRAKIETGEGRNNKYIKTCSRRLCRRSAKSYEGNEAKVEINVEERGVWPFVANWRWRWRSFKIWTGTGCTSAKSVYPALASKTRRNNGSSLVVCTVERNYGYAAVFHFLCGSKKWSFRQPRSSMHFAARDPT